MAVKTNKQAGGKKAAAGKQNPAVKNVQEDVEMEDDESVPAQTPKKAKNNVASSPKSGLTPKLTNEERARRSVCIKHLKPAITDEDLVSFLAQAGNAKVSKRVLSRGLAFVLLDNEKQATSALALNGATLNGCRLLVEQSRVDPLAEKKKLAKRNKERKERNTAEKAGVQKQPAKKGAASPAGKKGAAAPTAKKGAASPAAKKNNKGKKNKGKPKAK